MLMVVVRHVCRRRVGFGPAEKSEARRRCCSLLGITSVLGITWCLPFSCIRDTTCSLPVLYLFCIFNSLQGFFICVWLFVSKRKAGQMPQSNDDQTFKTPSLMADQKSQGQSMQE
ncbi:putative G-protein coupled receptor 114 [Scleropages formosus]|uniref:Putative G-protein coupled receptor 114 n=1 Tax=Scleropages formosus TaxID=113540 RepID=A0A0P7VTV6_SCLFO|nr:putative G-protein coupled receptor 114 [Scleropages formosus]